MQTSRFQLGLIATLAVGLGFSLASSDAVGYPAGAAVSMGENPVWSVGGSAADGETVLLAPSDADMVVTDAWVTFGSTDCRSVVTFTNGAGVVQAQYYGRTERHRSGYGASDLVDTVKHAFNSGIRVEAGDTLRILSGCTPYYTLSGYYAQP
mgnify:FL=1